MNIKLSIITPVYNNEKHIGAYFENLDGQTAKNFELICVNDCSADNSYDLIMSHIGKHDYDIKLFSTKKNGGPGVARNIGLEHAEGEYITFIDADDKVSADYVETLINVGDQTKCDVAFFDYTKEGKNIKQVLSVIPESKGNEFISVELAFIHADCCAFKLFKTQLIKENFVRFPELRSGEDAVFARRALKYAKSVYYKKYNGYLYQYNANSIVHAKKKLSYDSYEDFIKKITLFDILIEEMPEELPDAMFNIWLNEDYLLKIKRLYLSRAPRSWYKKVFLEAKKQYPDWYDKIDKKHLSKFKKLIFYAMNKENILLIKLFLFIRSRII